MKEYWHIWLNLKKMKAFYMIILQCNALCAFVRRTGKTLKSKPERNIHYMLFIFTLMT